MTGISSIYPKTESFLNTESMQKFGQVFDADPDDLSHEIPQAKRLLKRKFTDSGNAAPETLLQFTAFLDPYKDVFAELFRLAKIAVAILVSSAACERSFTCLKLIKTYLRNTMSDKRLSDLGVLHIERERTEAIDIDEFILEFANVC